TGQIDIGYGVGAEDAKSVTEAQVDADATDHAVVRAWIDTNAPLLECSDDVPVAQSHGLKASPGAVQPASLHQQPANGGMRGGDDEARRRRAIAAAEQAVVARLRFWDGVQAAIRDRRALALTTTA
ncbi:MAG: hypothetical protein WBM84_08595, partial [Sedimenticolaceae bacterium]